MTKLASLGCDTTASCTNNRKFMFAPDVVADAGGYLVLMGSGDREKPLLSYTGAASVSNHFFMVKDQPADARDAPIEYGEQAGAQADQRTAKQGRVRGEVNPVDADHDDFAQNSS